MHSAYAMLFPGQGSQQIGMLQDLNQLDDTVQHVFKQASDVIGCDLWQLVSEGPKEKLDTSEYTQPALLAAGVASWQLWCKQELAPPSFFAGHSLGEYTALVCADVLDFADAIELVSLRGRYMQQAVAAGEGGMAAIIGLEDAKVIALCTEASHDKAQISAANFNSPGQVVVSGHLTAVENVLAEAKARGAKLAKLLPVSVPSHCSLMQTAAEKLADKLAVIKFKPASIPVVQNYDVRCHRDGEAIKQALLAQLVNPVRWVETLHYLRDQGIHLFIEAAPGKVLTGLNKRIDKQFVSQAMANQELFRQACTLVSDSVQPNQ